MLVLTTTNNQHLDSLAGQETGAIEIVGKPDDLEAIGDAVVRSVERRSPQRPSPIWRCPGVNAIRALRGILPILKPVIDAQSWFHMFHNRTVSERSAAARGQHAVEQRRASRQPDPNCPSCWRAPMNVTIRVSRAVFYCCVVCGHFLAVEKPGQ